MCFHHSLCSCALFVLLSSLSRAIQKFPRRGKTDGRERKHDAANLRIRFSSRFIVPRHCFISGLLFCSGFFCRSFSTLVEYGTLGIEKTFMCFSRFRMFNHRWQWCPLPECLKFPLVSKITIIYGGESPNVVWSINQFRTYVWQKFVF